MASGKQTGKPAAKRPAKVKAVATATPDAVGPPAGGSFPIVGIGASAGGLAAFEAFFSGLPVDVDPGMAFVLVQHLAPDHTSMLVELVQRFTRMPVFEVRNNMVVQCNCTYIIPPACDLALLNGTLELLEPTSPRGRRLPVDFFFQSLAQDQHERAIGIVLSGTGSDGSLGVRAIKGEGGMVMAQQPASTEFDGMPRNAIATGLVDYELPPAEMAGQLMAYAVHAFGRPRSLAAIPSPSADVALRQIFVLLRAQTGHDFSRYKPSTITRRIERRMAIHQIETLEGYVKYLQQKPAEAGALFRDLLIGVTDFFRDPGAFQVLEEQVIPQLFVGKREDAVIRVWAPGCSTGEEVYSLAILLQEHMELLRQDYTVQIFATDIDGRGVAAGRTGRFPASIVASMSPKRLARFFTVEPGGKSYRIQKGIRDMVVFSEHDVIKDPPFSRLDLISCRNLLIYFGIELQEQLLPRFHYALNPGGFLFLGTSEGVGTCHELFGVLDRKAKVYQRKGKGHASLSEYSFRYPPIMSATEVGRPQPLVERVLPARRPLREMAEQALLQQVAPASALVNSQGDILYLHGRTGMYLEPASGEAGTSNILKMAREGLRTGLATALHKATLSSEVIRAPGLVVKTNSHYTTVNLTVCEVATNATASPESPLFLIVLAEAAPSGLDLATPATGAVGAADDAVGSRSDAEAQVRALKRELQDKDEYLQHAFEELQSSTEELKSANEEMQSVNEELQSSNEELETSKEELQSVNEELATINTELQTKLEDLSRVNNDMNNLLSGTGIATVFVDHQLRILRFTPTATAITNLLPSDVGRPAAQVVSNLVDYTTLEEDLQAVLDTLIPSTLEVQTRMGQWYSMRIQPYRTLDHVIEGAVLSFVDIGEIVLTRNALSKANDLLRLAVVVRDAHDAITVQDLDGHTLAWNPGAARLYGWSEAEALAMTVRDRIPEALYPGALNTLIQLGQAEILAPYHTQRLTRDGGVVEVSIISTALFNEAGKMYAVATTERRFTRGAS